jgi:hypothetical protein
LSDPVIISIVVAVQSVITAALAAWLKRAGDINHIDTQNKLGVIHEDVNGKMGTLLRVTGESQRAIGKIEGAAQEKSKEKET